MTIIYNGYMLDDEIKNLSTNPDRLDDTSSDYIELNKFYQKLLSKKISDSELAVNGCQTKHSLIPISEALGEFETALLMFDTDDHNKTNGLRWHGISTIRAGKRDKNHAGKSNILMSQQRPHPQEQLEKSMRIIYPMFASGTKLHLERMKKEGKKSPSTSIIINQANKSKVVKSDKGVIV